MTKLIPALILGTLVGSSAQVFASDDVQVVVVELSDTAVVAPPVVRPLALPALYASLAALQAYDGYSTLRGVAAGARETNPLVGGLVGQPVAFWTLKAGSTALSVYLAEQYWRDGHRTKAVVTMVAANALMAAVAARNAQILRR